MLIADVDDAIAVLDHAGRLEQRLVQREVGTARLLLQGFKEADHPFLAQVLPAQWISVRHHRKWNVQAHGAEELRVAVERRVPERHAYDAVLLALVRDGIALARRGAQLAADVVVRHTLRDGLVQAVLHEGARAHVLRLLLDPDHLAQVRIAREQLEHLGGRERVEQLDAPDCDVAGGRALLVADDVVVDLAAAEDEAADGVGGLGGIAVGEDRLEAALGEGPGGRSRVGVAEEALRRHDDQRALLRDQRLAAQQVEVVRRRRAVRHTHVALGAQLQEALQAAARVLRTRALVAMGKEQRQA